MAQITQYILTPVKNLTDQTLEHDPTRLCHGEKFEQVQRQSRYVSTWTETYRQNLTFSLKVFADATLVFPMLVAATFAQDFQKPDSKSLPSV